MEIHITDLLFQIINFSILLFVLGKFLYKPILKVLDERATKIKEGLEAAEKNVKLQGEVETEKKAILTAAKKEADTIVKEAKKEAEALTSAAALQAKKDARSTLEKEKSAMFAQLAEEKQQLQKNMSAMVIKATEQVLKDSVSLKVQKDLVDKQIKSLTSSMVGA